MDSNDHVSREYEFFASWGRCICANEAYEYVARSSVKKGQASKYFSESSNDFKNVRLQNHEARSIEKYFGKPYKGYNEHNKKVNTYIDKTGTYYTHIHSYKNGSTNVMVGTKKSVAAMKGVKRLSKK